MRSGKSSTLVWWPREFLRGEWGEYRKWVRYCLDFCHKVGHPYVGTHTVPRRTEKQGRSPLDF